MTTRTDEWVFSLCVPASVPIYAEDDTKSEPSTSKAPQILELRLQVPIVVREASTTTKSIGKKNGADEERVSLLTAQETTDDNGASSSLGWTLTSPFWSFSSHNLLTITYCPAWQAMPEYTNRSCTTTGAYCCCGSCCCGGEIRDFKQQSFSTADVISVRRLGTVVVHGVGNCQALQVCLAAMVEDDLPPVPVQLRLAWLAHVDRMKLNRQTLSEQGHVVSPTLKDLPAVTARVEGPVLTFCLPTSIDHQHAPPLLWKVELPALSQPVAVETMTVLDGKLHTGSTTTADPTHIFINGFQSWSFTGSIVRGDAQPTSALPDTFSRAFNFGGSAPPQSADTVLRNSTPSSVRGQFAEYYKSDYFTCITSDAPEPTTQRQQQQFPYQQLDETGGPALILGWLSQLEQFGVITADQDLSVFQMHASAHGQVLLTGDSLTTDWAFLQLVAPHSYDEEPMAQFLHAAAAYNHARPLQNGSLLTGWCSWYVFYEKINARILRDNFGKLAGLRTRVPTNVAVVDDGVSCVSRFVDCECCPFRF